MKFRPSENRVEQQAEAERQANKPMAIGQVFTYFAKLDQARAFLNDPGISQKEIPHLMAEAELKGLAPKAVAMSILREYRKWAAHDAQIETKRMQRKRSNEA